MKFFTPEEDAYIRANYLTIPMKRISKNLGRSESSARQRANLLGIVIPKEATARFRKESHFKAGHVPPNKGKKQSDFMTPEAIERTKKTRFKKGNHPHTTKEGPGTITVRLDKTKKPYQFICIEYGKWLALHTYNWNKVHGKVPKGYCLWFKDGDTMNPEVSNLECITRMENIRRNSGPLHLRDNMVATYMATKSRKVDHELKALVLDNPNLIELKRNQLLLNRAIKAKENDKV